MRKMKLGIIGGGGLLGSTTAFVAGSRNVLEEIKLLDLRENMAKSHAMDMGQALKPLSRTVITAAVFYEDFSDCQIILNTASLPEKKVANRNEYLEGNLKIVKPICQSLKKYCRNAVIINATNPIDVFNYVVHKEMGWDKRKIIGFSANDTLRFRWAIEQVTGKEFSGIEALCIGEHGDGQLRLYDQVRYEGEPFILAPEERKRVEEETGNWFRNYQALESGRTSGWTSAVSLAAMIEAIATDSRAVIPCSVILEKEFGYDHVSVGLPASLGTDGIQEICFPELNGQQRKELDQIAEKIRGLIRSIHY